ncbi:unnamed protein product [Rotaria magnacalcarata]|uniref:Uncharacterized protein n=4 Tax=Rotaria magnacalcarata TaxID=392030 RepID=A0A814KTP4_9BILA|nr:unnamed protein product [Rotaria magnacalcarata]CAF1664988.1 unnamed protein product [Rotaria magnacalcarata]CAF2073697.1 unnamed protein product [Rotaria magnacalcarata]CAF4329178.1 unnamed protein product [Rotaria magnacalcarata]
MTDLFSISDRISSKSRRTYSQRNVSSLHLELTKNCKLINVKTSKTTILNRTLSFKPLPVTSSSLTNVENTPMKKLANESNKSTVTSKAQEIIEETPIKEETIENDAISSDKMTRDIQKLAHRLRSSIPLYEKSVFDNQSTKPAAVHLSQVVNRVSRCNYVLRNFVREAQKYSATTNEIQIKSVVSLQSSEKGRRRLFVDSPKQDTTSCASENQPPTTPRKASGVIKQLFASPSPSFKRTPSSSNINLVVDDKRQKLF